MPMMSPTYSLLVGILRGVLSQSYGVRCGADGAATCVPFEEIILKTVVILFGVSRRGGCVQALRWVRGTSS